MACSSFLELNYCVFRFIEFQPSTPFSDLVDEIADIRRQAAANPRLTAYADVVKLLGKFSIRRENKINPGILYEQR